MAEITTKDQTYETHLSDESAKSIVSALFNDTHSQPLDHTASSANQPEADINKDDELLIENDALPTSLACEFHSHSYHVPYSHKRDEDEFDIDKYNARFEEIHNAFDGRARTSSDTNQAHQEAKINKKLLGSADALVTPYVKTKKKRKEFDGCDLKCAVLFNTLMQNTASLSQAIAYVDKRIFEVEAEIEAIDEEIALIDDKIIELDTDISAIEIQRNNFNDEIRTQHQNVQHQEQVVYDIDYYKRKFVEESASGGNVSIQEDGTVIFSFDNEEGETVWVKGQMETVDGFRAFSDLRELSEAERVQVIQELSPHDDPSHIDNVHELETGSVGACLADNHPDTLMVQDALTRTQEIAQERLDAMQDKLNQTIHSAELLAIEHERMLKLKQDLISQREQLLDQRELKELELTELRRIEAELAQIDPNDENCQELIQKQYENVEKLKNIQANLTNASKDDEYLLGNDSKAIELNNQIFDILDNDTYFEKSSLEYKQDLLNLDTKFNVVSFQYDEGFTTEKMLEETQIMLARYDGNQNMNEHIQHATWTVPADHNTPKIVVA